MAFAGTAGLSFSMPGTVANSQTFLLPFIPAWDYTRPLTMFENECDKTEPYKQTIMHNKLNSPPKNDTPSYLMNQVQKTYNSNSHHTKLWSIQITVASI